jgi:uncharacterized protein
MSPTYKPGTPMWVDLSSTDVAGSVRFYSQLFGWDAEDLGEEAGHYNMFRQGGKAVAAVGPIMNPGQPAAWNTYVATDNAEETARRVSEAGGQVIMAPMQVMDQGSMAVFTDPAGAFFSVWQPAAMQGAEIVNEPNSFNWNELATTDVAAAKSFYPRVFGWGVKSNQSPEMGEYVEWQVDGQSIAGGMELPPEARAQVPPHWLVYFAVADADETIKRAEGLGAKLMRPPMDIPQGRFAIMTDPQGAAFAVIALAR